MPVQVVYPDIDQFPSSDPFAGVNALRISVRGGAPGTADSVVISERFFPWPSANPEDRSYSLGGLRGGRRRFVVLEGCAETVDQLTQGTPCTALSRGATPPGDYLARGQEEPEAKRYSEVSLFFARVGEFAPIDRRLTFGRAFPTAIDLGNGKIVIAGGASASGAALDKVEVFDLDGYQFVSTGSLSSPRLYAAGSPLGEGGGLVAGGFASLAAGAVALRDADRIDANGKPVPLEGGNDPIELSLERGFGAAALLRVQEVPRVLVSGGTLQLDRFATGELDVTDAFGAGDLWTGSSLTPFSPLNIARTRHTATTLSTSGRVLLAGGWSIRPQGAGTVSEVAGSAEVVEHGSATPYKTVSGMRDPRWAHTATEVARDGMVFLIGGADTMSLTSGMGPALASVDVFRPGGVFGEDEFLEMLPDDAGNPSFPLPALATPRAHHTAARLPDDSIIVIGGASFAGVHPGTPVQPLADSEILVGNVFVPGPSMVLPRVGHAAFTLPDGKVLVVGGYDDSGVPSQIAEIYTPRWPEDP